MAVAGPAMAVANAASVNNAAGAVCKQTHHSRADAQQARECTAVEQAASVDRTSCLLSCSYESPRARKRVDTRARWASGGAVLCTVSPSTGRLMCLQHTGCRACSQGERCAPRRSMCRPPDTIGIKLYPGSPSTGARGPHRACPRVMHWAIPRDPPPLWDAELHMMGFWRSQNPPSARSGNPTGSRAPVVPRRGIASR